MACYLELIVKFFGLFLLIDSLPISHGQDGQDEDLLDKVAVVPGTFTIAALFSVHEASSNLYYPKCGPIQDQAGMQRVEAALWELKRINEENKLKKYNHTFGLEIRDTCGSYVYAFQQGLSIHNSVLNIQNNPIVGTVGPAFSAEIRMTHEWIGKHMPQIGFSASSPRMTNKKDEFENFARLVPPDNYQARVVFDLIDYFGLDCVNIIITAGVYGSDALKAFKEITETTKTAKNESLCIGSEEIVYDDATEDEMKRILQNSTQFSGMVVCFCEGRILRKLYQIADQVKVKDQVLFINSDGWTETDNMTDFQQDIIGSIMINPSPQLKIKDNFANHYYNLSNWNPSENPWKEEFIKHRFNCSSKPSKTTHNCTGHEALQKNFFQDPKVPLVRHSIRAIADAINHFVDDMCHNSKEECNKTFTMKDFENLGSRFMNYSRDRNFKFGKNSLFRFNEKGDPNTSNYEILSYAKRNGKFTFHVIGSWNDDKGLVMNEKQNHLFNKFKKIKNKCNIQCPTGFYRATKNCCWTCMQCNENSISHGNDTECQVCDIGLCKTPNQESSECVDKKVDLLLHKSERRFSIFIAILGVALTSYTIHVFYKHRRTPIVKFSSTHLSFIIFFGMGLAYSTTILNLIQPNSFTCMLLRFIPSLSLSMIYGPILIKTNRISRAIFANEKRFHTLRMKYLSAASLVSASLLLVFADVIFCIVQYITTTEDELDFGPNCVGDMKIFFCPLEPVDEFRHLVNIFLLGCCALYVYKSGQHLPDNFNEAKFVIVSCGATAVVWSIFLVAYRTLQEDKDWIMRALFLSIALSLSALINLVCMYFPKLYVILYRPTKNHRAFYSTMTGMRCYFGNTESGRRGFSSVNIKFPAGDPNMKMGQNTKTKIKHIKLEGSKKILKKILKNDTKSKLSNYTLYI